MKKFLTIVGLSLFFISCSEDYLDTSKLSITTDQDIADLAKASPEKLLVVATSFDVGNANNLRTYGVGGSTGHYDFGQKAIDLMMDLMGNDMINFGNGWWFDDYYKFTGRVQDRTETSIVWNFYYEIIKGANQTIGLIGGLDQSTLTDDLKYVLARSIATRSFAYLQLIQIYQKGKPSLSDAGVPIIDPSADLINGPGFGRNTVGDLYNLIEADLNNAYTSLTGYSRADKTSIDKKIVAGLLARFYLLKEDYINASKFAIEAQSAGSLNAPGLKDGFQNISNSEWIWGADLNLDSSSTYASFFAQMQSYSPNYDAANGLTPGYTGQLGHHKTVDKRFYDLISSTDVRKDWFGPDNGRIFQADPNQIYNYKFYDDTFFEADYVFMRVAEMHLIEAEAKAAMGDDAGASQALYNLISTRDSSYTLSTNAGVTLMNEIKNHRRIELWGEGFGMLDLKRWGEGINRIYTGSTHPNVASSYIDLPAGALQFTFQIPEGELNTNDAINSEDQNP